MSGDLEKIEERIAVLREELDRLEIARDVLSQLRASAPIQSHGTKTNGAAFTIKRVAAAPAAAAAPAPAADKPARKAEPKPALKDRKAQQAKIREKLDAEIRKGSVVYSSQLCKKFHLETAPEKQLVYQALYLMKKAGLAERLEDGAYRLVQEPPHAGEVTTTEGAMAT